MFKNIEKQYKRKLVEYEFRNVYWSIAIILFLIYIEIKSIFRLNNRYNWIFYLTFFIFVFMYYLLNYIIKTKNIKGTFKEKFNQYIINKKESAKKELIKTIKKYGFNKEEKIKILFDYFSKQNSIKLESSLLSWISSFALTTASFVSIAYDSSTNTISMSKLSAIFESTFSIVIITLFVFITIKFTIKEIAFSQKDIHSLISEDLLEIFINFNKYKKRLNS